MSEPGRHFARYLFVLASVLGGAGPAAADDGPPLSVYGFARLDLIVDSSRMSDTETPYYVDGDADGRGNSEMAMHPRLSRVGLSLDRWQLAGGIDGEGALEVDFQNGGADAGALMRLRHAYVSLSVADRVELLTGQTWDLMSPLFPSANNDSLMSNAGNTGDRRPQVRLTMAAPHVRVGVSFSASGAIDGQDLDGDGRMDGVESGAPMVQGLIEQRWRVSGDILRAGVWGHVGREQLADGTELASWSIGSHLMYPVTRYLTVMGEIFHGQNLDDVRGGIGQGVNLARMEEITSTGGWLEAAFMVAGRHMFAGGNTFDVPSSRDLDDGARDRNITGYGVYRYRPHQSIQLGAEFIRWFTGYKNARDSRANRVNLHMTVFF